MSKEIKKARFEQEDKVRPVTGAYAGHLGIVKEVHDLILTASSDVTYRVRFNVTNQFGFADYDYIWYTERELSPNMLSQIGFKKEEECINK